MAEHWVEDAFKERGAILEGHFVLSSKLHTGKYLDKILIYPHHHDVSDFCREMADLIRARYNSFFGSTIEAVVGPSEGGIILSNLVAFYLDKSYQEDVFPLFTKKNKEGKQFLPVGYQKFVGGRDILVVDDILSTGGTLSQVIREVEEAGGNIKAAAVICNRGETNVLDCPVYSLWDIDIKAWPEDLCPLCKEGVPVNNEVGRGKEYLEEKARE